VTTPDSLIAEAEACITSGRLDAVAAFQRRYGRDFEGAVPQLRAKLLAIRDGGLERSLPQPRATCSTPGCTDPVVARGACEWHDQGEG
jgi:hypothetical protein